MSRLPRAANQLVSEPLLIKSLLLWCDTGVSCGGQHITSAGLDAALKRHNAERWRAYILFVVLFSNGVSKGLSRVRMMAMQRLMAKFRVRFALSISPFFSLVVRDVQLDH